MDTSDNHNLSTSGSPIASEGGLFRLDFLCGKWKTEGEIFNDAGEVIARVEGTDTYEWVTAGKFLLHRVDVMMGETKTEVIEMIGLHDIKINAYAMRSFDNEGNFVTMTGQFEPEGTFNIGGNGMRASLKYDKGSRTINVLWEKSHGDRWIRWIAMKLIQ